MSINIFYYIIDNSFKKILSSLYSDWHRKSQPYNEREAWTFTGEVIPEMSPDGSNLK